jgi:hypothetical protein
MKSPTHRLLLSLFALGIGVGCRPSPSPYQNLTEALLPLCRALPEIARRGELLQLSPEASGAFLRTALEPHRARLSALAPSYHALSPAEQRLVLSRVSQTCGKELREFYLALSGVTARLHGEEEAAEMVTKSVRAWKDSDALWAFELFAHDTVAELREMAEEEGEREAERDGERFGKRALGGEHVR